MVTGEDDGAGLEDYSFPMTQDTQEIDEMSTEVQAVDVLVPSSGGAPRPRSTRPYSNKSRQLKLLRRSKCHRRLMMNHPTPSAKVTSQQE
jgi:hypothetical protein